MTLKIDERADAPYLVLDDSAVVEYEEITPGMILDFNDGEEVVAVEILYLSKRKLPSSLKQWAFESARGRPVISRPAKPSRSRHRR